jgi:hypothetical protein
MGFLYRILGAHEVIASEVNVRVINRLLEKLAIHLEDGSSKWFSFAHDVTDRPLKQTRVYRALNSHKLAQLQLRIEATRFLRKPDI